MSRQIDYYFSMPSPWAYIGHKPFSEVVSAYNLKVNYKPLFLGDLFSETGGLPLGKRHPARQKYRMVELQRWRDRRGLDFKLEPKHWPFAGPLPDGMVIAAIEAGLDPDAFLRIGFAACWEQERDLADPTVLVQIANEAGLPGETLLARATAPEIAAIYKQNLADAVAVGVIGAPGYVLDGEVFWGQDRIELLADALKSGRKAYSSDV